jgi:hypothetical protein
MRTFVLTIFGSAVVAGIWIGGWHLYNFFIDHGECGRIAERAMPPGSDTTYAYADCIRKIRD